MSLWLQAAMQALSSGDYEYFRVQLLPRSPIPVPGCIIREIEFAERKHLNAKTGLLFPIRLLWLLEANEQRLFGAKPLGRSIYHPKKLLALWQKAATQPDYRQKCETDGIQFDLAEGAIKLSNGWIYIGNSFVEDLQEIEAALGVEMLFPSLDTFQDEAQSGPSGAHPTASPPLN